MKPQFVLGTLGEVEDIIHVPLRKEFYQESLSEILSIIETDFLTLLSCLRQLTV